MINHRYISRFIVLAGVILMLASSGCTGSMPPNSTLEQNWGRSFETQRHIQAANPDAGKEPAPSMGMDGAAADVVMDEYRKSFSSDDQQETVNIIKLK